MTDVFIERCETANKRLVDYMYYKKDIIRQIKEFNELEQRQEERFDALIKRKELLEKGVESLKAVISILSQKGLRGVETLVTEGLGVIFFDRSLRFEIEIADRGKDKKATFWIVEDLDEGVIRKTCLEDSQGHGIQTIVSFILRVFFILHLNLRRFIIMDESMSQLAECYLDTLFTFIDSLKQNLGFDILAITHDKRFLSYADKVMVMETGKLKEVSRRG